MKKSSMKKGAAKAKPSGDMDKKGRGRKMSKVEKRATGRGY